MRATKKTLFGLIAALAACIAATLLLTFAGRSETAADRAPTYYFTNYAAPEELLLASLENDTGSVVLAAANGIYYAAGDVQLAADSEEVKNFFGSGRQPMGILLRFYVWELNPKELSKADVSVFSFDKVKEHLQRENATKTFSELRKLHRHYRSN